RQFRSFRLRHAPRRLSGSSFVIRISSTLNHQPSTINLPPDNCGQSEQVWIERRRLKPETSRVRWRKIALVGVGLLGGSLGMSLPRRRLAGNVTGFVRRAASVRDCLRLGAVDHATLNLHEAVADADLIVLCTPIGQMPALAAAMLPALKPGAVV